jgi:hypothetical protein
MPWLNRADARGVGNQAKQASPSSSKTVTGPTQRRTERFKVNGHPPNVSGGGQPGRAARTRPAPRVTMPGLRGRTAGRPPDSTESATDAENVSICWSTGVASPWPLGCRPPTPTTSGCWSAWWMPSRRSRARGDGRGGRARGPPSSMATRGTTTRAAAGRCANGGSPRGSPGVASSQASGWAGIARWWSGRWRGWSATGGYRSATSGAPTSCSGWSTLPAP